MLPRPGPGAWSPSPRRPLVQSRPDRARPLVGSRPAALWEMQSGSLGARPGLKDRCVAGALGLQFPAAQARPHFPCRWPRLRIPIGEETAARGLPAEVGRRRFTFRGPRCCAWLPGPLRRDSLRLRLLAPVGSLPAADRGAVGLGCEGGSAAGCPPPRFLPRLSGL